jgi:hypothetical protein
MDASLMKRLNAILEAGSNGSSGDYFRVVIERPPLLLHYIPRDQLLQTYVRIPLIFKNVLIFGDVFVVHNRSHQALGERALLRDPRFDGDLWKYALL